MADPGDGELTRARYMIVRGADFHDLASAVSLRMDQGWSPTGGVMYVPTDPMQFAQAAAAGTPTYPYWQALIRD